MPDEPLAGLGRLGLAGVVAPALVAAAEELVVSAPKVCDLAIHSYGAVRGQAESW